MPTLGTSVKVFNLAGGDLARLESSVDQLRGALLPPPAVAMAVLATAGDAPAAPSNIVGLGVGTRIVEGDRAVPSIVVLVRRKVGPAALPSDRLVPDQVDGFRTSVVEVGDITAMHNQRHRPPPCGVTIGNCTQVMAGTLGCFVRDLADDRDVYVLSNNHVLALVDTSLPNAGIPQPGRLDGGVCGQDVIATLSRKVPIDFLGPNLVDAAIAQVTPRALPVERRVLRANGRLEPIALPQRQVALNDRVQKSGRTTGHTRGTVTLVGVTVNVNMGGPNSALLARFDQQFQVTGQGTLFSRPGDSGSLVTIDDSNAPVGLLFAGGNGVTFCNEIANVLTALNVAILN